MPAGRNQVAYDEIRYDAITMKIDGVTITHTATAANGAATTMIGKAVSLSADDTVQLAADGEAIFGKLLKVEHDGFASIQRWGFVALPSSGTITRGTRIVGALATAARGYIRSAVAATAAETAVARGTVVNIADTAAVWVDLG